MLVRHLICFVICIHSHIRWKERVFCANTEHLEYTNIHLVSVTITTKSLFKRFSQSYHRVCMHIVTFVALFFNWLRSWHTKCSICLCMWKHGVTVLPWFCFYRLNFSSPFCIWNGLCTVFMSQVVECVCICKKRDLSVDSVKAMKSTNPLKLKYISTILFCPEIIVVWWLPTIARIHTLLLL